MAGVSYVVTVYNKAPYLPAVLDALAGQAGDFERQFIFVDDGSTDGGLDILRDRTAGWRNATILSQADAGHMKTPLAVWAANRRRSVPPAARMAAPDVFQVLHPPGSDDGNRADHDQGRAVPQREVRVGFGHGLLFNQNRKQAERKKSNTNKGSKQSFKNLIAVRAHRFRPGLEA